MAVYTKVSDQQLHDFLITYGVGQPLSLTGIAEGVENSNYLLETTHARYILTLYEKRVAQQDLPFFLSLMAHLANKGLCSPAPVVDHQGAMLNRLCGKPAALVNFCEGTSKPAPSPSDCAMLGSTLAQLHEAAADFPQVRANSLSLAGWQSLVEKCVTEATRCAPGLGTKIENELAYLRAHWPAPDTLPYGVIHADLFSDNVLFKDEKITGVLDFYFSCTDFYAYDLAICLNAWVFDTQGRLLQAHAQKLLQAYQKHRPLTEAEKKTLPIFLRGSALRFLLTRLYDWIHRDPNALVQIKNPLEYFEKLRFHQTVNLLDILS